MKKKILTAFLISLLVTATGCGHTTKDTDTAATVQTEQSVPTQATTGFETIPETDESPAIDVGTPESGERPAVDTETPETDERPAVDTETPETGETPSIDTIAPETELPPQPIVSYIDFANCEVSFVETTEEATPVSLSLVSEKSNNISEVFDWYAKNDLYLPMLDNEWASYVTPAENAPAANEKYNLETTVFYDESYIYSWSEISLDIYDRNTEQLLYSVCYDTAHWSPMGPCAYLRDGILYIGHIFNGYARPDTCYILAYDIENKTVLWRSEDQTYNTANFIVKDDVIICGYGFTDEKDYIYQIDMQTGEIIEKIEIATKPDLLVEKDGQLYVHAYSCDYIFDMD